MGGGIFDMKVGQVKFVVIGKTLSESWVFSVEGGY
jgi:hypothetical protein